MGKESKAHVLVQRLRRQRPRTAKELAAYVRAFLGWRIPDQRVCPGHDSPLDYLAWSFLGAGGKTGDRDRSSRDCYVWANRGGGKTQLGSVASLLECLFLPGC